MIALKKKVEEMELEKKKNQKETKKWFFKR